MIRLIVLIKLGIEINLIIFIFNNFFNVINVNILVNIINIRLFFNKIGKNMIKVIIVVSVLIFILYYFLFNLLKCFWCDW